MFSLNFLTQLITVPWVVFKTIVQFYTVGTPLQADPVEFGKSLKKNVSIAIASHLIPNMRKCDPWYQPFPVNQFYDEYRGQAGAGMPHFGEPVAENSLFTWVVRPEGAKKALLYVHGGGYLLPMSESQLVGIMAVWYAVDPEKRQNLAIANIDYSLTHHGKYYPTQIYESVEAYRELVKQGYEVLIIGDSAGANMALVLARFFAYPEAARAQFSRFTEFAWDFLPIKAPRYLLLIAPWVSPWIKPERFPGVNYGGDLGCSDPYMGGLYLGKEIDNPEVVKEWVNFHHTNYEDHWAKTDAFNGNGATLVLHGEREIFRLLQNDFFKRVGIHNCEVHLQPGEVHDAMFYVEPIDLMLTRGQGAMVAGKHREKFSFKYTADFIEKWIV